MDLHITISGTSVTQSFTVVDDLANFLVSEFPDNVQITERPDFDIPELTQE